MARSNTAGASTARAAGRARHRPWYSPWHRLAAVAALALLTANCSNNPQKLAGAAPAGNGIDAKYGVKASPRLYNEGDVIPKGGGRRFSGKPYVVAGRTYVPREDARGYRREGLASWYGSAFHGRMTANGEVFDRHSIAAAHPTLPLPSYARVTNLGNGHSMIVRVNDRGPYHADRLMDVSEEVAQALEFHRAGTTKVRVEYVGKASVAGSDDAKLMASLRTDGRPAGIGRSPVMLADLGPDVAGPADAPVRAALAFKPASEARMVKAAEDDAEEAPARAAPPLRPAPVLTARAAIGVPAAVQPTRQRGAPFRPEPVQLAARPAPEAPLKLAATRLPGRTATSPMRVAGLNPDARAPRAAGKGAATGSKGTAHPGLPDKVALGSSPAARNAMPGGATRMARLDIVPPPVKADGKVDGKELGKGHGKPALTARPATGPAGAGKAPGQPVRVASFAPGRAEGGKPSSNSAAGPSGKSAIKVAAQSAAKPASAPGAGPAKPATKRSRLAEVR